jgi:FG-GAP-like repeat
VCWIDYNNDGWLDLFAVDSYADTSLPAWEAHGGLPRSELFENVHGKFVNITAKFHAGVQTRGTGCVAADFNGDGYTDLFITTATDDELLWNNGNGTFTEGARSSGVVSYGWHAGAAVADVNGDGRPDLFVAGYTNMEAPITSSMAGFPTNYEGPTRPFRPWDGGQGDKPHDPLPEWNREAAAQRRRQPDPDGQITHRLTEHAVQDLAREPRTSVRGVSDTACVSRSVRPSARGVDVRGGARALRGAHGDHGPPPEEAARAGGREPARRARPTAAGIP